MLVGQAVALESLEALKALALMLSSRASLSSTCKVARARRCCRSPLAGLAWRSQRPVNGSWTSSDWVESQVRGHSEQFYSNAVVLVSSRLMRSRLMRLAGHQFDRLAHQASLPLICVFD